MKKTLLIIAALFAMAAYAQEPLKTVVRKIDPPHLNYDGCIEGSGNCRYLIFSDRLINDFVKLSRDLVVEVAKDGSKSNVVSIERHMDFKFMAAYEDNENIYMLYRRSNYYTREFTLYLNVVPKEADIDKWKPIELLTLKRDFSDGFQMGTAVSPDKTKVALLLLQVKTAGMFEKDKSDKLKGSAVMVFEGDKIKMTQPLEFDVENNTLQFLDMSIDNNGEVLMALASFNRDNENEGKKGSQKVTVDPNETVHLYKINADEVVSASTETEFGTNFYSYLVFTIAAVTDLFDGYLARKYKQTSKFGAFLDPVADKLIVCSALVLVVEHFSHPNPWIKYSWILTLPSLIIIGREILISALREWMAELSKRTVVSVSWIGKWKTTIQMFAIAGVIWQQADWMVYASVTLLYVAALLTVISMVQYLHAAWNDLIADM